MKQWVNENAQKHTNQVDIIEILLLIRTITVAQKLLKMNISPLLVIMFSESGGFNSFSPEHISSRKHFLKTCIPYEQ